MTGQQFGLALRIREAEKEQTDRGDILLVAEMIE